MFRKSQPNFQHYVKKIEAQAKNGFLKKKTCILEGFDKGDTYQKIDEIQENPQRGRGKLYLSSYW